MTAWIADVLIVLGLIAMTLGVYGIAGSPTSSPQLHASSKAAFGSILLVTTALGGGPSILARVVLIVALLAITTPLPPMPAPRRPTTSASRCAPAAIDAPHARRWGCAGSEAQGVRSVTPSPEAS